MPATFETLDAARLLVDYVANSTDQSALKALLLLIEGIAKDLEPAENKRPANSSVAPEARQVKP